jgi:hypothetical protein
MAGAKIALTSTAGELQQDANGNALVATPQDPAKAGVVVVYNENDDGAFSGVPYRKSSETSPDYRQRSGIDSELFCDNFNALNQNTAKWSYTFATLTAAQPGAGTVNFSTVQGTTAAHGAFMRSHQYFGLANTAPLAVEFIGGQFTAALSSGEIWLMGLGLPTAAITRPTDGAWFRISTAGVEGVIAFNGAETTATFETPLPLAALTLAQMYKFLMVVGEREVEYWWDDKFLGHLDIPPANGVPWLSASAPVFLQKYNTGAVSNTNTMRISRCGVSLMDIAANKPWSHQRATMGLMAYQGQNGGTMGTTALLPNATAATVVTGGALSQTVAIATGLGGQAGIVAAVPGIDGLVTAFQNPIPTINLTGQNLIITGVRIDAVNIGAAVATTATVLQWSLAFGATIPAGTIPSLAQVESASFTTATAKAWRRVPLGLHSWAAGAAIGVPAEAIRETFDSPIVVHPGQWVAAVAKFIVGTATASQVIWAVVKFDAYYE